MPCGRTVGLKRDVVPPGKASQGHSLVERVLDPKLGSFRNPMRNADSCKSCVDPPLSRLGSFGAPGFRIRSGQIPFLLEKASRAHPHHRAVLDPELGSFRNRTQNAGSYRSCVDPPPPQLGSFGATSLPRRLRRPTISAIGFVSSWPAPRPAGESAGSMIVRSIVRIFKERTAPVCAARTGSHLKRRTAIGLAGGLNPQYRGEGTEISVHSRENTFFLERRMCRVQGGYPAECP